MAVLSRRQIVIIILLRRRLRRKKNINKSTQNKRRFWVRQIYRERKQKGEYHLRIKDMRLYDQNFFSHQFRMTPVKFEELLSYVGPHIKKSSQNRELISPDKRLCVTLHYLCDRGCSTNYC